MLSNQVNDIKVLLQDKNLSSLRFHLDLVNIFDFILKQNVLNLDYNLSGFSHCEEKEFNNFVFSRRLGIILNNWIFPVIKEILTLYLYT